MSMQQFCLRWNNHQPNFISVCSSLLHNGTLVDVTLAAEGRQLQAHKIVLSACSSYFQTLFTTNPCQHPIVILKDVQYDDLKTMVDFMYYGEVNVSQEQLPHILKTAEMLKIKGLAEMPTDPANLTKSDSKSSNEGTELVGGTTQSGASASGSAGGLGSSTSGSVSDSIWGSTEAQFQQQQAAAQQQHHHHQQQQQLQQQQQQQQAAQQQQQQQAAQQQQQQHHHHHHHHQQQSSSQTQTTQVHHQLRRTPSPLGVGASPATRRKRLRKSSNNGSGDRNNSEEQHSSLEASNTPGGISLSQMNQMSFSTGAGATLGSLPGHTLHTAKLLKESASADLEQHPQDSDLEDGHGHIHMQIKPEVDIGGVNQSMPLDISGATTPSEHDAPNSQSSHSETARTAMTCTSYVTERAASVVSPIVHQEQSQQQQQMQVMGTKRNRVLTRQPRVKRDSDSLSSTATTQVSPDTGATLDFDPFNTAGTSATNYSTSHHAHTHPHQHTHPHHQHHHHHHHHLLTVPPRIERHASEPAPSLSSTSPQLLSVPQSTPYLIKQHSDPLLPSQHSAAHISAHAGVAVIGGTNPFSSLHRQYSHPLSGSNAASYVASAPLHHPHHISLPESIYASGSPPPAGSSQYAVPQHIVASGNNSNSNEALPAAAVVTSVVSSSNAITTSPSPPSGGGSIVSSSAVNNLTTKGHSLPQFTTTYVGDRRHSNSPSVEVTQPEPERLAINTTTAHSGNNKLRSSKSTSGVAHTDGRSSGTHLHPGQPTTSSSFEHLPTLRVKNEELQRSVSSPQTQREIITLENPRSSHCPVIRPGPALGCNFCWNTIDGHGRILRRKTKYHCPECQTNLCIVPCFQEYHERINNEAAAATAPSNESGATTSRDKGFAATNTSSAPGGGGGRHYAKTESI